MSERYVIALDQGTTSSRAMLVDRKGRVVDTARREFAQLYPQPGWVGHRPEDILSSQVGALAELVEKQGLTAADVDGMGITNQRETTIVWNRETGKPIADAIVWQCRRTAPIVEELCSGERVRESIVAKTGLQPDAYFSASKVKWLLDNTTGARRAAEAGELCFGTVDSWLVYKLTGGAVHATDRTNASRTMLYDIHRGCWDDELLRLFDKPPSMLPEVLPSSCEYGTTACPGIPEGIPICGVAGDQQSALFGQCCFGAGQAKNTYGTGCFLLMHTGERACRSQHRLVTTIAASAPGREAIEYALEGSVFMAGALVQWMRDELGLIRTAAESELLAASVPDTGGVYIVPAFTGLGAPYWRPEARGAIYGLTRGTTRAHVVRAGLEALAYQLNDLVVAMEADSGVEIDVLNVDGGATANDFLLQFQSDICHKAISRPENVETTGMGAAYLAGLATGFWSGTDEIAALRAEDAVFEPAMDRLHAAQLLDGWKEAVLRTM